MKANQRITNEYTHPKEVCEYSSKVPTPIVGGAAIAKTLLNCSKDSTVKLGFKELLNKEQIGNSDPFSVTNLQAYLINSEQISISEQFCNKQNIPYAKFDCSTIFMVKFDKQPFYLFMTEGI